VFSSCKESKAYFYREMSVTEPAVGSSSCPTRRSRAYQMPTSLTLRFAKVFGCGAQPRVSASRRLRATTTRSCRGEQLVQRLCLMEGDVSVDTREVAHTDATAVVQIGHDSVRYRPVVRQSSGACCRAKCGRGFKVFVRVVDQR